MPLTDAEKLDADRVIDSWIDAEEARRITMRRDVEEQMDVFKHELELVIKEELDAFRNKLRQELRTELKLHIKSMHAQMVTVLAGAAESAARQTKAFVERLCTNPMIEEE
jgi:hypothetical protein